jgi:hypothetical protein
MMSEYFLSNVYNAMYLGLSFRFANTLKDERVKQEKKRIKKIWK